MKRLAAITLALILLPAGPMLAADMQHPDRRAGEIFIAGATLVDPPPEGSRDSHAYLTVTGASARDLYRTMKAAETKDACSPGRRAKRLGALHCSVGGKPGDARCDFAIDLTRGALAPGLPC